MTEETTALDKKKVETIKLLLSSLFARKQKYLVIDGEDKNRLIYANFPYERTIYYRSTPEDTLCGVTINNQIIPILHEAFPIFENIVAEINLQPFMSTLNKCLTVDKTKWPEIIVNKENDKLYMINPEKDSNGNVQQVEIGRLLPPEAHKYYDVIMDKFMDFSKIQKTIDFSLPSGRLDDDVILGNLEVPKDEQVKEPMVFKLPLQDGVSMVSFKEYLKKRGYPLKYNAIVQYHPALRAAKIAMNYMDDWVNCISIMPGTIWFPF